ncbi:hypothetical protein BU15DRAFT_9627, partial [Melanogaster broomeanus]
MSSIVYQRRVWGICEPAVGVIFSKSCTVCQVVFAWLGAASGARGDLPPIHIVFAAHGYEVGTPLGIFDLATPADALAFAQFVPSLQAHCRAIANASSIDVVNSRPPFSWRSDLVIRESTSGWMDRMRKWKQDVHV